MSIFPEFDAAPSEVKKGAELSDCGDYRYVLYRTWGDVARTLPVVMVNPSTADAEVDDPTILRLMAFARRWGYGALVVVNLFALRSSTPDALDTHANPCGPDNQRWLDFILRRSREDGVPVLAAWGNNGYRADAAHHFALKAERAGVALICLGRTQGGFPKHPLARGKHRIPDDFVPIPFGAAA